MNLRYITVLIVFCFTILFAYDYFPSISQVVEIPKSVLIFLVIGLVLASIYCSRGRNFDNKDTLKWQVFITGYIFFLMGLFTFLGGESATGISFRNGFFWLVLLISLVEMFSKWRKVKSSQQVLCKDS
ncbi:hypothetical protein SAMN05216231_1953 [Virgibacillus salinus]|uniref:Uncharacterized protein n=1 Tax=Virgibacillus salinus TaxID=553311 RepID=A0A1H1BWP7_9BACI|nr:hypothetical protein SAMN05216231_1953 [Virgibacillus salinus]